VALTQVLADDRRLAEAAFLADKRVIVLVGTRGLARPARAAITERTRAGGGLLLSAGPEVEPGVVRELLAGAGEALGAMDAVDSGDLGLTATDLRHPVLAVLGDTAGNLGQVRVEQAWITRELPGAATLLRYASGRPALSELTVGKGRVFLLTTDLGRRWNTWPLHPTFVPFLAEAARHLAADGGYRREALIDPAQGDAFSRPGVATLRGGQDRVAVNVDVRESTLESISPQAFEAGLARTPAGASRQADRLEGGRSLWRDALLVLMAVLLIEGWLAARPRGGRARGLREPAVEAVGGDQP
jgi:hypothetical protein